MTVPVIDGVDHKTFEYRPVYGDNHHYRGYVCHMGPDQKIYNLNVLRCEKSLSFCTQKTRIFEWGMLYKENEVPPREQKRRKHNSEPYKSPTHAGGLFAINREFFLELGN